MNKKILLTTTVILLATSLYTGKAKAADCVDDNGVAGKSCTFITVDGTEKLFSITYNDNTSTRYIATMDQARLYIHTILMGIRQARPNIPMGAQPHPMSINSPTMRMGRRQVTPTPTTTRTGKP